MPLNFYSIDSFVYNKNMNIAYVITGLGIGGAEKVTVNIANRISRLGNNVIIIYLVGENLNQQNIDTSIKTYGINMKKNPVSFFICLLKVRKILKNFKPDIVHGQMFHANIFIRILRLFVKIPKLISTEHNSYIGGDFRMFLYRTTDFLSDLNTNVSQEATDYFVKKKTFSAKKSRAVYNGIDLEKFKFDPQARQEIRQQYKIDDDDFMFLNVGRLVPAKDQKTLIEAFAILNLSLCTKGTKSQSAELWNQLYCVRSRSAQDDKRTPKLMIVGDGELRSDLEDLIKAKNISDKVIFAGKQDNTEKYYSAADCFVLSSAWEGFGIVVVEAMACKLPVVATDAGGVREVLDDDSFIIPIKYSQRLKNKMLYVMELNKKQRAQLGKKNIKTVQRYDINIISNNWLKIYQQH
ncbi:MAG: glycosyltransferase [Endomicrobium sp.]|jgi:glycosyltransferase involved in cell wall biosynthesis|nr:glycosyltransferase [Endomicrobium sp.]